MQSSKVNQEWKKLKKPGDEKGDASLKPHRCTCGINNKELRNVCCNPEASTGRQYASRCPCLKGQQSCGGNCKRNGCNNPYGKKVNANITKIQSSKRKRNKDQMGGERKRELQFMIIRMNRLLGTSGQTRKTSTARHGQSRGPRE